VVVVVGGDGSGGGGGGGGGGDGGGDDDAPDRSRRAGAQAGRWFPSGLRSISACCTPQCG
jgi:hypothetical protein